MNKKKTTKYTIFFIKSKQKIQKIKFRSRLTSEKWIIFCTKMSELRRRRAKKIKTLSKKTQKHFIFFRLIVVGPFSEIIFH